MRRGLRYALAILSGVLAVPGELRGGELETSFRRPPDAARPWAFWYWMNAAVSREGITADLEAMSEAGLGGAYLMPIRGAADPPQWQPPVEQLTPEWWGAVLHALQEADRLGLRIAMHASDGFALAGGPWITPELSMQKLVWTETRVAGGRRFDDVLTQPPAREGYYRDIAVLAFPSLDGAGQSTRTAVPKVTTSQSDVDARFLSGDGDERRFRCDAPCWIQYEFEQPFTCRSLTICTDANDTYHANRLILEAGDDGQHLRRVGRLEPPRHGWQDGDAPVTHALAATTARVFRFRHDPTGAEPGAEDLDSAKWRPVLELRGIELSSAPRLHQFEGKSGAVWRVSRPTTKEEVPQTECVRRDRIVDVTRHLAADGRLAWDVPPGRWTILRVGHTSTGHRNETGGGGRGLECDKFSGDAVRLQFDRWFGEAFRRAGPRAGRILSTFHVDSWECGSQNWSKTFRREFERRRGYDLLPYLPAMAGIPVESAFVSERFLHDVRQTIAELVVDVFYDSLAERARDKGVRFTAENVAPTMTSDGMLHFRSVDEPMGEFWLRSPTHDKRTDMLDATPGAHVYGKLVVQAEAFTELRLAWDEHPAMLKAMSDRNYALGINRFVYHVFTHNPWLGRRPGMTLSNIGLFFQRDQTWWRAGRAWVDYARRCQALLQWGRPVADVAVFTGEEVPRRAVLPERLVSTLPGIVGAEVVRREEERLANRGGPVEEMPAGVWHSAKMADPADWTDPLRGYAYDSINPDVLLRLATVRDGRIELPGGASYAVLVLPGAHPLSPVGDAMTPEIAARLRGLVEAGATVIVRGPPTHSPSLRGYPTCDRTVREIASELWPGVGREPGGAATGPPLRRVGQGRVLAGPFREDSFATLGIEPDLVATDRAGERTSGLAWTHRSAQDAELYFLSNQRDEWRDIEVSLRVAGRLPELWDPVSGDIRRVKTWRVENGRTLLPLRLAPSGSLFVVLRETTSVRSQAEGPNEPQPRVVALLDGAWQVSFDPAGGGPEQPLVFDRLLSWTERPEHGVRHHSGTAAYERGFRWEPPAGGRPRVFLDLGEVANLAEVTVNGRPCGVAWTRPYRVEITEGLRPGDNRLRIEVTNTWANRLIGDQSLPEGERLTWTTASSTLVEGRPLLVAGLLGPVTVVAE
jgi:hypothetical protein